MAAFFSAVFSAFFTARFSPTSERAEAIAFVTIARHLLHLDDQRIDPAKNVDPEGLQDQHNNANTREPDRGAQETPQPRRGLVNLEGNCAHPGIIAGATARFSVAAALRPPTTSNTR